MEDLPKLSKLYINGEWVSPLDGGSMEVVNPATEEVIQSVGRGTKRDIDVAVQAAREAFTTWGITTGHERAKFLRAMADAVEKRMDPLAFMDTIDCGKPLPESKWDIEDVVACFRYYADLAEHLDGRQNEEVDIPDNEFTGQLRYEPVGVVAAIVPWNFPMLMSLWKVAPALAAGCTMVLKPSELTPLSALQLGHIATEVGLPQGVLNVITGDGPEAGAPLSEHPDVDKVAFTGSVPTGSKVMSAAAQGIKTISLELGGKSASIVFDDKNIERTVEWVMFGCFGVNGQICSATSRLLIHEDIADKFLERLAAEVTKMKVGNPTEADVKVGPLVSRPQQQKVLAYIDSAVKEGAKIFVQASPDAIDNHGKGYYVHPTVLTSVSEDMKVWKEEIFGPVLSVMTFKNEEQAVKMANASDYGLAAAIFSSDSEQLRRVTKALRVGIVWHNCSQPTFVQLPWGGMKKSGVGRELGTFGLDAYLEPKQVCSYVADKPLGWYLSN